MTFYRKIAFAGALALGGISTSALAVPITLDSSDIGDSFTINYDGSADGNQISGLSSTAIFTLTGITSTSYLFDYSLTNTSSNGVDSRVSSFGINVSPDITGASSTGTFSNALLSGNYPNPIKTVDVCFKDGGSQSCSGSGGVGTGDTGSGTLSLDFGTAPGSISLDDFFVRYQSITGAGNVTSATGMGTSTSGGTPPPPSGDVPEPGMLGLLAAGLVGIGLMRGRRRQMPKPQVRYGFA